MLRSLEKSVGTLTLQVRQLECRLTDVKGELSDDLKTRIYQLERMTTETDKARAEAETAFTQLKRDQAVELSTLRAQVAAKSKLIQALQGRVDAMGDQDELAQSYEMEKKILLDRVSELEMELSTQRTEREAAEERAATLEASFTNKSAHAANGQTAAKDKLELLNLETQLKETSKKLLQARESLEKEQIANKAARVQVEREVTLKEQLAAQLVARDQVLALSEAAGQRMFRRYRDSVAALTTKLHIKLDEATAELNHGGMETAADAHADVEREAYCDECDAALSKAVSRLVEQVEALPAQLEETRTCQQAELKRLKERYETRVQQLKNKLTRKDKAMAGYDEDLARLTAAKAEVARAQADSQALQVEMELLRGKVAQQKDLLDGLRAQLQDKEHLKDVLMRHQDVRTLQLTESKKV